MGGSKERASAGTVGAIVLAAGRSRRMAGPDKVIVPLGGRPLVAHALSVLNESPLIDAIVLVMSSHNLESGRLLAPEFEKVIDVCLGGDRRQDSVRNGLDRLLQSEWIVVHDGSRFAIDETMIARGLAVAENHGAAVAAVPSKDTIKLVDHDMLVTKTLPRDSLWLVQTPQVFRADILRRAHREITIEVTDDASMIEMIGGSVGVFMGAYDNIKVTTPEDMPIAEAILRARGATQ